MITLHVLGVAHYPTSSKYNWCAFTQKILNFCSYFRGLNDYKIIFYGVEGSEVSCDYFVQVASIKDIEESFPDQDIHTEILVGGPQLPVYQTFLLRSIGSLLGYIQNNPENNIILNFSGSWYNIIEEAIGHAAPVVEVGIGYAGATNSKYRIFESGALRGHITGLDPVTFNTPQNWFDIVIPNSSNKNLFDYSEQKGDYCLFIGRLIEGKGLLLLIDLFKNKLKDEKLVISGLGYLEEHVKSLNTPNITYVGPCDINTRRSLMSNAKVGLVPSLYAEPFGAVQVEYMLSGTPIITTDTGAFPEVNMHNVTGFIAQHPDDIVEGIKNIKNIKSEDCYNRAINNYTWEANVPKYQRYFSRVLEDYNHQKNKT